jgi:hypothetical protein
LRESAASDWAMASWRDDLLARGLGSAAVVKARSHGLSMARP